MTKEEIEKLPHIWCSKYGEDRKYYFKYRFVRFGEFYIHSHKGIETCVLAIQNDKRLIIISPNLYDIQFENPIDAKKE